MAVGTAARRAMRLAILQLSDLSALRAILCSAGHGWRSRRISVLDLEPGMDSWGGSFGGEPGRVGALRGSEGFPVPCDAPR